MLSAAVNPENLPASERACRDDHGHPFTRFDAYVGTGRLDVHFRDGSSYRYEGVRAGVLRSMQLRPRDAGCIFNRYIRFSGLPFRRL